jgi:hypothetical protein
LYKRIPRWQVDDYNTALESYNQPFTQIVGILNAQARLSTSRYTVNYNPPMPPWVAEGSADNDFIYRIDAYRGQLAKARETVQEINRNMAANAHMIKVLNTPPTPMPPESIYVSNEPRPVPAAPVSVRPVVGPEGRPLSPEEKAYRDMFEEGRVLLRGVGVTNYEAAVPYNPPVVGDGRRRVDEKFFELRDLLRKLYAERTGFEPANLVFPVSILSREGFAGPGRHIPRQPMAAEGFLVRQHLNPTPAKQAEGFVSGASIPYNGKLYECAALTDYQLWKVRTFSEKRALCAGYGYTYIDGLSTAACPCYREVRVAPPVPSGDTGILAAAPAPVPAAGAPPQMQIDTGDYNTSLAPEPETAALYRYNLSQSDLSYETPRFTGYDGDTYKTHMAAQSTVRVADIRAYYDHLNKYNHWWLRLNGWKTSSYNPPRPFWYADNSTDSEAVAYKRSIAVFNDKVEQKKGLFESLAAVNLPADFGQLPAHPVYPNTLHDLLQNPAKYADPARASSLPSVSQIQPGAAGGSGPQQVVEFQIPVADVSKILTYVAQKPPAPAPVRPKCGSDSMCTRYKEPPAMVKKFLEDREKQLKEQRAMNERINSYTMGAPRASAGAGGVQTVHVNTSTLKQLRESIMHELGSFTTESVCSE